MPLRGKSFSPLSPSVPALKAAKSYPPCLSAPPLGVRWRPAWGFPPLLVQRLALPHFSAVLPTVRLPRWSYAPNCSVSAVRAMWLLPLSSVSCCRGLSVFIKDKNGFSPNHARTFRNCIIETPSVAENSNRGGLLLFVIQTKDIWLYIPRIFRGRSRCHCAGF